ncbi:MATE family efflux transporter [Kordiimonas aestuarii]|uniref:MATE family efflux transporter n=1 Tax=Kordiimonas aestuarii TaxID=1005925 RepID=UPI0021D15AA8|nr:MATE family efflux transporter [Kordiimonas aestuarii]
MTAALALNHPHKRIWAIAGPAIIANSSAPLVGLVDTWVIGHLPGARYLAAVSIGAMIFSYLYWAFGFLRMSTTGLIAQAHGRGDSDQIARILTRALLTAVAIGTLLVMFQGPIHVLTLEALDPPPTTIRLFSDYFAIRVWALPAALLSYAITGYLIGTAQATRALYVQLVLNIANAALNLFFVLGLALDVRGVALGSLIAEWLAVAVGLLFVVRSLGGVRLAAALSSPMTYDLGKMKKLLSVNGYIFARTLLLILAFALMTRQAAALGQIPLAASHVLNTFLMLIALGLDGFAYAAEALSGAAYGRGARLEFRAWVRYGLLWSGLAAVVYSTGFGFFGTALIHTLTNIEPVRAAAAGALPVLALLPLIAFWCYLYDGIYIGATAGGAMLGTAAVAAASFIMVLDPLTDRYGLTGLWIAMAVFLAMRGLAQAVYYPRIERRLAA